MKNVIYQTKDFYISAILLANKVPLSELIRENNKYVTFCFSASPETCEEIIKKHWNRTLKVESRLLIESIHELRTRLHEKLRVGNEELV